jgi:hypothetical protein
MRAGSMAHGSTGTRAVANGHQDEENLQVGRPRLRRLARSQQPDQIVVPKITRLESARPHTRVDPNGGDLSGSAAQATEPGGIRCG